MKDGPPSPPPPPAGSHDSSAPRGLTHGTTPNSPGPEVVPPQWAWHHRALLRLRQRLVRAHKEQMTEAITAADMRGLDVCEPAGENPEHELLWLELGKEDDRLFEVDCALQRIRDGVFGFCEETGHAIPAAILRARPWTRYARVSEPGARVGRRRGRR